MTPRPEEAIFTDLLELAGAPGFAHVLAAFCFRDNIWGYDRELKSEDLLRRNSPKELIRSEIATLQGLMMRGPMDLSHPGAKRIQEMMDRSETLLQELHESLMQPWFEAMTEIARTGDMTRDPFSSAKSMREPIFYGADSAYDFQYLDLAKRKYSLDDDWLIANKGFSIDNAVTVGRQLQQRLTDVLPYNFHLLRRLPPEMWTILPAFFFSAEELVRTTDLDTSVVEAVLNAFTDVTSPRNETFKSIGDFNSANSHPLLLLPNGRYLLFQTYGLLEAIYESPFYWMMADKTYRNKATENRGKFTEQYTTERLRAVFGEENVTPNVKLVNGKEVLGEVDVLVRYGTRAVVVQAKSKKLTIAARKGNDAAMQKDFAGAVQDAYDQARACSDLLLHSEVRLLGPDGILMASRPPPELMIPMCVVSDHYPALSFQSRQYLKHEESDARIAPVVCDVFLVDVLCEMLDTPLQFLSYIERRSFFDEKVVAGNELAILAYHLKSNLWVGREFDMVSMDEAMTVDLDVAMMARRAGVPGRRIPKGILIEQRRGLIGKIVSSIEQSDEPAKFDLGMMLLTLSGRTVEHLGKGIEKIARQARTDGHVHDFTLSIAEGGAGITVHATNEPIAVAAPTLRDHCLKRKYLSRAKSWFGVAVDPRSAMPRASLEIKGDWKKSEEMEVATAGMRPDPGPEGKPIDDKMTFEALIRPLGRNDRCWCGSGKKYKACHLDSDLAAKWGAR